MENSILSQQMIAIVSAFASYFYGGWSHLLGCLLAFVVLDYITGIIAAAKEGKLQSTVGFVGIAKKVMIFAMIGVAHMVDKTIGEGTLLMDAAIFFYQANVLLSIIENAGRIGLPVQEVLKQAVELLKNKEGVKK